MLNDINFIQNFIDILLSYKSYFIEFFNFTNIPIIIYILGLFIFLMVIDFFRRF